MEPSRKKSQGFTITEFVVVMVIMVILLKVSEPIWSNGTLSLDAEARRLIMEIRYTQQLAMTQGVRYRIRFNSPSTNAYQISDINGNVMVNPGTRASSVSLPSGMSFGSFTQITNQLIAFDGQGIPYTNTTATTALASQGSFTITYQGETRTILISPNTGRVILQ